MMAMASSKKPSRKKSKRVASHTVHVGTRSKLLSNLTDECLNSYFENLNGHKPGDLYQLVIGEVEKPLFRAVLTYTNGNQSEAKKTKRHCEDLPLRPANCIVGQPVWGQQYN